MRFRQLGIRYEVTRLQVLPSFGDPWVLRMPIPVARPEWRPPIDLCETASELSLKMEIAGLSEENTEIVLYENILVVSGDRSWHCSDPASRYRVAEIRHGPFRLELPIPSDIDRERVSAQYDRGFLIVNLPKAGTKQ